MKEVTVKTLSNSQCDNYQMIQTMMVMMMIVMAKAKKMTWWWW